MYCTFQKWNEIIVSRGCTVTFRKDYAIVHQDGEEVLKAQKRNKRCIFESKRNTCFGAIQTSVGLWHNRYGHLNYASLSELVKHSMVQGINCVNFSERSQCLSWMKRKIHTVLSSIGEQSEAPTGTDSHGCVWSNRKEVNWRSFLFCHIYWWYDPPCVCIRQVSSL